MPCKEDHEFSQRLPPNKLEVLRKELLRAWSLPSLSALKASRLVDVDREGCVEGIGEAVRDVKKDEEVEESGTDLGDLGVEGRVSSSSSTEMRRRFRGRRLGVMSVEGGLEFMAIAAGVAQSAEMALKTWTS